MLRILISNNLSYHQHRFSDPLTLVCLSSNTMSSEKPDDFSSHSSPVRYSLVVAFIRRKLSLSVSTSCSSLDSDRGIFSGYWDDRDSFLLWKFLTLSTYNFSFHINFPTYYLLAVIFLPLHLHHWAEDCEQPWLVYLTLVDHSLMLLFLRANI